jgi:hypothetical protein
MPNNRKQFGVHDWDRILPPEEQAAADKQNAAILAYLEKEWEKNGVMVTENREIIKGVPTP